MPIPDRSRNKNGRIHKKRSDAGKARYSLMTLEGKQKDIEDAVAEMEAQGIKLKVVV